MTWKSLVAVPARQSYQPDPASSVAEVIPKVNSKPEMEIPVRCLCINKDGKDHGTETTRGFLEARMEIPCDDIGG